MEKIRSYLIAFLLIAVIILLFPPVTEHNKNDGYSFILLLGESQSIDTTKIIFQLLLSSLIIFLLYLLRDKIILLKSYLTDRAHYLKKVKNILLPTLIFLVIIVVWWNASKTISDLFLYSESDLETYVEKLNPIHREYLQHRVSSADEKEYKPYNETIVKTEGGDTVLISSLKLPNYYAKRIIEKYLVDKDSGTLEKVGNMEYDVGGLNYAVASDMHNIDYAIPEGKTIRYDSFIEIIKEVNKEKLSLYKATIIDIKKMEEDYILRKNQSEKFEAQANTIRITGTFLIILVFVGLTILNQRKSTSIKNNL